MLIVSLTIGGEKGLGAQARSLTNEDSQIPRPVTCRTLLISLDNDEPGN